MSVAIRILNDMDDDSSCGNHSEEGALNFSDTDPKDSGIECSSEQDMPDDETASAIMKTVEYYLSDSNILKDPFLLKHVRRNKEGYVSLKLLASFRKVRCLSHNWKAVAYSVQKSAKLTLNSDGTKVKRVDPLPDDDQRSIIVSGFENRPSVDTISEMFGSCGDISLVRILSAEMNHHSILEFEEHAAAKRALELSLPEGISAAFLKERPKVSPKKKKSRRRCSSDDLLSSSPSANDVPRRHSYHPTVAYNDPNSSFASLADRHRKNRRRESENPPSPWRQLVKWSSHQVKTIRMPRGPDGTNGFSRSRLPSTAE